MRTKKVTLTTFVRRVAKILRTLTPSILWIAALFLSAGTFHWLRGWICVAVYAACLAATGFILYRWNHDIFEARAKWTRTGTKAFDRVFLAMFLPLTILQPAVAGLDAVRFHTSSMSTTALVAGIALYIYASGLITWTLLVNRYAEFSVRIQSERGHAVVSTGPYRYVRHPMYVGCILMFHAVALILGSGLAMGVAAAIAGLLVWRTALEDGTLRRELPGYAKFSLVTRYRLLPGVW